MCGWLVCEWKGIQTVKIRDKVNSGYHEGALTGTR